MSEINLSSKKIPLKLSKKEFTQYKEKLEKFLLIRKDEYKNLFESFDVLKQKKFHLSFLLFSYYNSWVFPYISYNKIARGNIFSSTFEIAFIFKKLSKNMNCPFDEKMFILWYFYIYYNFFIKEKKQKQNTLINQMRYLLLETGKIVINFYENKYLSLDSVKNIIDVNLLCFEYFIYNSEFLSFPDKIQKAKKLMFFINFFHLLKEISVITLKQKTGFDSILSYLDKLKQNSEINDEINIIMLFNNNILQDFMQNILDNIDVIELKKIIPDYKLKLINFYSFFLKNRYKNSNLFKFFIDTLRHSFIHLYNFKQNKNVIINDIFKNNFNSILLNKLYKSELTSFLNSDELNQLNTSFFFDTKTSNISFENVKKITLDQVIIFLSFRFDRVDPTSEQELPLFLISVKNKKKNKVAALKIFLKKSENDTYKLLLSQQKDDNLIILNEDSDLFVNKNQNNFCAFYLNGKKLKIYLFSESDKKGVEIKIKEVVFNQIPKDEFLFFYLGIDEKKKNNININFYRGKIGPFIIIKAPKNDIIPNKDIDKLISDILSLCENYQDFIIFNSDFSKYYNLRIKDYYWQKFFQETKKYDKIKGNFECLIYLNPENFQFYNNRMLYDEVSFNKEYKRIPVLYKFGEHSIDFVFTYLNVNILHDENFIKLFITDNGINFFCLLFEYYNQFLRYYLLKKEENIFKENELDDLIKDIIESVKIIILMLGNHNYSKYTYNSSKKILNNLYNCILNLNKIKPIINDFKGELIALKDINKGVLINHKNEYESNDKPPSSFDLKNKSEFEKLNNYNFIKFNISYFIGIMEILLTPELFNNQKGKDCILLIDKILNPVFNGIKDVVSMIDLTSIQNIFYKLLSLISIINNNSPPEKKEENEILINEEKKESSKDEYMILLEKIFRIIISFLNSKTDNNNITLAKEYFNKLFLFVFGCNRKNYNVILAYLNIINETSKIKENLKLEESQILELKKYLFEFDNEQDKVKENEINVYDEKKQKIQYLIIDKIYEYLFTKSKNSKLIGINFLDNYLKQNKLTKELFTQIQNLLNEYFVEIFKSEKDNDVNNPIQGMNIIDLNYYFQKIFSFLKFFIKVLKYSKDNDLVQYLPTIYDIMFESQQSINIQEEKLETFYKYIIYLINFVEFLFFILIDNELHFLLQEEKIFKIIDELYNKCAQSTLIHCEFYLVLKDDNDSSIPNPERKLISEIFIEIYKKRFENIYDEYRLPGNEKKEVDKNDLDFIKNFNGLIEKKMISEFNFEIYDIKKQPFLEDSKSIFFVSDFLKLSLEKKISKRYSKNKEISQKIKLYKLMIGIIVHLKADYIELSNKFDFYHTTYHFYEAYELFNIRIDPYFSDKEIQKHENLKQSLEETKTSLLRLKKILLNDHLKINLIYKDYYSKSNQTNDTSLKNMLKAIQGTIFNKKFKNVESTDLINNIENDFSNLESKTGKSSNINSKSSGSTGSNPSPKGYTKSSGSKDSLEGIQNKNFEFINSPEIYGEFSKYIFVNDTNNKSNDNNSFEEIEFKEDNDGSLNNKINSLMELINHSNTKNILNKLDKYSTINPKKEIMNIIFGTYFSETFFENESFKNLKNVFLNTFKQSTSETKLLNYPSKLKNFLNGLHPSYFLKENNKFYISKIFPITHEYYYKYMIDNNLSNESIILLKDYPNLEVKNNSSNLNKFTCELIKSDKVYYGQIINSEKEKILYFSQLHFEVFNGKGDFETTIKELNERGFTLSALKYLETESTRKAREKAENVFLDQDVFPNGKFNKNKTVIIFYDDIEEIIERRILYVWQGLEIFLKNGKSYMFNMIKKENYEGLIKNLKTIPDVLFREKDFMQNMPGITQLWRSKRLNTFEYLLYLNKYSSRSYNDINQYYVLPWIVRDFSKLIELNKEENELYEYKLKHERDRYDDDNEEKDNKKEDNKMKELYKNFRNLKYPVSAQEKKHRITKREKFNDEEERFQAHHGTHYSTSSYLDYYVMRIEPFTSLLVELQNYNQEDPNRLLLRLKDTIAIINTGYDNRELIPEYYSKFDYFININCVFFGFKKSLELVDDIESMWEDDKEISSNKISIYSKFIIAHKKLLNSDIISSKINIWIDNIFGYMQIPPPKKIEKSINIFPKASYEQYTDLHNKLEKLQAKYEAQPEKIIRKFTNKINVITSFGQCPHQIFSEKHKTRGLNKENDDDLQESDNYGFQDNYLGTDFIETYMNEAIKNDNNSIKLKNTGLYFEINPIIDKIIILGESNEMTIIDSNFYCYTDPKKYNWVTFNDIKIPPIILFNSIKTTKNNNYYIYNVKYAISSFPEKLNNSPKYLYANEYLNNMNNNYENKTEKIQFITCRHLDKSFKIHLIHFKKNKINQNETFSYVCEDFVMCCKAFSHNKFIIGLRNGKLIKAVFNKFNIFVDKNKKKVSAIYEVMIENYITGHLGSINVLEIDKNNGIVITGGDDNKIFIRKLYDFELLTRIQLKDKFVITMVKVSPNNLLYVICFNRIRGKSVIFGYSLSGIKFAKSNYAFYKNIEFTPNGNIISLDVDLGIQLLYGHDLNEIKVNENDNDYKKFHNVQLSFDPENTSIEWMQFNDFKNYYGTDRSIITYISKINSKDANKKDYTFKTLKVTNISYFE